MIWRKFMRLHRLEHTPDPHGYRTGKVKTAEGAVDYSVPQVRATPEPFVLRMRLTWRHEPCPKQ